MIKIADVFILYIPALFVLAFAGLCFSVIALGASVLAPKKVGSLLRGIWIDLNLKGVWKDLTS